MSYDSNQAFQIYRRQRGRFESYVARASEGTFKRLAFHCLCNTQLCLEGFNQLANAAADLPNRLSREARRVADFDKDLEERLAEFDKLGENLTDPEFIREQEKRRALLVESHADVGKVLKAGIELEVIATLQIPQHAYNTLFFGIYREDSILAAKNAVQEFLSFLLGLAPVVGPFYSGIMSIKNISEFSSSRVNTAGTVIEELDTYILATLKWCIAMEVLTSSFDRDGSKGIITFEEASRVVQARFQSMLVGEEGRGKEGTLGVGL